MNTLQQTPLCVDLDGTFIRSDLLHETILLNLKNNIFSIFLIVKWLLKGRAYLKYMLAENLDFDVKHVPIQDEVLRFVQSEWHKGRPIYLVTAATRKLAVEVTRGKPYFTEVISSTEDFNLKGENKADYLVKRFGEKNFDYIGDSIEDIPVFQRARIGYFATKNKRMAAAFSKRYNTQTILVSVKNSFLIFIKAARIHQWAKNLLIFVPLILAHQYLNAESWGKSIISFFCFGLCASGVYLLNDLLDLEADRRHHSKKNRPLASGNMSILSGITYSLLLFITAFLIATFFAPINFLLVLFIYFGFTCIYSFRLKKMLILDTISLALLYTIRIIAGHSATGIAPSHWLLAFALFIFLSLAFLKRTSELFNMRQKNIQHALGRAYSVDDFPIVQNLGVSAGFIAVLVFILYLDSSDAANLYKNKNLLLAIVPIFVFWVGRAWTLASRGQINEDPIIWAFRDRTSHFVLLIIGLLYYLAH